MTKIITSSVFNIQHLNKVTEDGRPIIKLPNSGDTRVLKLNKEDLIVSEPATPRRLRRYSNSTVGVLLETISWRKTATKFLKTSLPV
ncbi:unnamed protein product [Kuraishia capsulata CBS 1993]|uniref:Uncharacterized protein n=1 Tax=Kuraishia capsulata CBS 1993 TaxID=1382522 RepID=W6MWZ0_9ASCO|nr:uncharacterized protein KUCA_T00003995001 [Kuraishia capsulata CBS 1993]CDK28015.1 unnamed protein product [Kuraishia capsulata CBS 1993]